MQRAKLITNLSIGLVCLVASFIIVLFLLGGLLDYLSQVSNNILNETGLGFADGEADPSFLWVLLVLMPIVAAILMIVINWVRGRLK
ncbi:hypothetical protein [Serratia ficaria]|uniref:hypothetical protein n=1 Tax=Serratia ficaria TaxID=61651 RepID=UPI00217AE907|nr:hypothetical protein [Serratia ficaria]CAI1807304.1 Uncharacterised protein [Serratia ficaria]